MNNFLRRVRVTNLPKFYRTPARFQSTTPKMAALTPEQVQIIKSTVPVLAEHGQTITTKFYKDMLSANPALKNIFNNTHQATGHQPAALAGALYAYAANIDNLGALSPAVELICHKHASLYITAEQYGIVGHHLIETLKTVLGPAGTPEILGAWGAAYWQLANIMISKEAALYAEAGAWNDWKDFKIARKVRESEEITSFYLTPVDPSLKIPTYKPGQYISVQVFVPDLDGGIYQARQYSLSGSPGQSHLRISVKKEPSIALDDTHKTHPGYISNLLHNTKNEGDTLRLSHPFGDFFLPPELPPTAPVVLIAAGVGQTALGSILYHLTSCPSTRPISWIHGARSAKTRAFKSSIDDLAARHPNLKTVYFASAPGEGEVEGREYTHKGRVDLEHVPREMLHLGEAEARYFVCGPEGFMLGVEGRLRELGVGRERVFMEVFGTGGVHRV